MSKKSIIVTVFLLLLLLIVIVIILYPQFTSQKELINPPDKSQQSEDQESPRQTNQESSPVDQETKVSVGDYKKEMNTLITETENLLNGITDKTNRGKSAMGAKSDLNIIREKLTAVRVPAQFRDLHLSVYMLFVDIENILEAPDELQLNIIKQELQDAKDDINKEEG